jgi:hypothetical protein
MAAATGNGSVLAAVAKGNHFLLPRAPRFRSGEYRSTEPSEFALGPWRIAIINDLSYD